MFSLEPSVRCICSRQFHVETFSEPFRAVAIPVSHTAIASHEAELVGALLNAATQTPLNMRWRALSWLNELSSQSHNIRLQIAAQQKVPELIAYATDTSAKTNENNEWLLATRTSQLNLQIPISRKTALTGFVFVLRRFGEPCSR